MGGCVQALARPVKRVRRSVQLRRGLVCDIVERGGVRRSRGARGCEFGGVLYSVPKVGSEVQLRRRRRACQRVQRHERIAGTGKGAVIIRGLCITTHKHRRNVIGSQMFASRRSAR